MNNADFWKSVRDIFAEGFTPKGLQMLDYYAELFISGRLVYQRFSPLEQHGCAAGGETHVIASLLAGAEDSTDSVHSTPLNDFQRECQRGAKQEEYIERWAHVEQPFIEGDHVSDEEIGEYVTKMGFELRNPRNWTYASPRIYLSDMHDENVIRSKEGNIFVVDCDIRINTPELRAGGTRQLTTAVNL